MVLVGVVVNGGDGAVMLMASLASSAQPPDADIVADADLKIAKLYDMIHPDESETAAVRSVFLIDPDKKVRLTMTYPMSVGRNFDEILRAIDALQFSDKHGVATPADWRHGKVAIIPPSVSDEDARARFPQGFTTLRPYLRTVAID